MKSGIRILALSCACILMGIGAQASGTYSGGGVRPPIKMEPARYELGKAVFTGKAKLGESKSDENGQKNQLEAWQKALSPSLQRTANLPALAGRLSAAQLDGLGHFLQIRYSINTANR